MPAASSYSWCLQSAGEFQNGLECLKAWLFFLDMKCHTWFTYKISYSATNYSVLYLGEFVLAHHALVQLTIHLLHSSQTLKLPSWMLQTISICLSGLSETQMAIEYFKGESIFLTFWTPTLYTRGETTDRKAGGKPKIWHAVHGQWSEFLHLSKQQLWHMDHGY